MSFIEQLNQRPVREMGMEELRGLAQEIRAFLVENVSQTGGHLSSNLGAVELTLALHKTLDLEQDKLIFDVGHQCYTHKILTGRADRFSTLRQMGGLSGFPKSEESRYDCFNTGHSSTSISAALGMAVARDLAGEKGRVAAVIGDGALTGGMAFEALNDAGHYKNNFLVILNDNEMSIARNVGSVSEYLNTIRNRASYFKLKDFINNGFAKMPRLGKPLSRRVTQLRRVAKFMFVPGMFFEELGFYYVGPVDGHDIEKLCFVLDRVKDKPFPIFLHVNTVKGRGYLPAEENPQAYHGIGQFNAAQRVDSGKPKQPDYSFVASECLLQAAERQPKLAAITAAMPDGTGLCRFAERYPDRFFDVGIAEQHAATFGAGLAKAGYIPALAVYSSFLQRAYDQVLHDVALQKLHFLLLVDRAGVVGQDGETHQGIYDLSYLSSIPNLKVLAPGDFADLRDMINYALFKQKGPVAIRYPRGGQEMELPHDGRRVCTQSEVLREGTDVVLLAVGKLAAAAMRAAELLERGGVSACVVNVRAVKPLDLDNLCPLAERIGRVVTLEDNTLCGGFGSAVAATFAENARVRVRTLGFPDHPIEHGSPKELYRAYGLDADGITRSVKEFLR